MQAERCKQSKASEQVGRATKQANGQASGSVLMSRFLFDLDHSEAAKKAKAKENMKKIKRLEM